MEEESSMNYEKCLRCGGRMLGGEPKVIPKEIRLPMGITINTQSYLPDILKQCSVYKTFVCEYCRYVEFFVN